MISDEKSENVIAKSLIKHLEEEFEDSILNINVEDARIGLAYTGIKLSNGYGGVACTPLDTLASCVCLHKPIEVLGKPAHQVMQMSLSHDPLESVIGIATINALAQMIYKDDEYSYTDVLDFISDGDKVSMIGYFRPMIQRILDITKDLNIVEKKEVIDSRIVVVPEHEVSTIIPISDVVIISATTLINKTLDGFLELSQNARDVIILGPTATMVKQPFFERGITAVMGTRIYKVDKMMEVIGLAGGTNQIHKCCAEKVGFINEK